jgi:hypothetical protein
LPFDLTSVSFTALAHVAPASVELDAYTSSAGTVDLSAQLPIGRAGE